MKLLALTVPLHADEILTSYCSRTAAVNGIPSMSAFARHMGFDLTGVANGRHSDIRILADAVGLKWEQLERAVVRTNDTHAFVRNQTFARHHFRRHRLRFCPHCVVEDETTRKGRRQGRAYARLNWSITFIRTCPVHRSRLITSEKLGLKAIHDFVVRLGWERSNMPEHLLASKPQEPTKLEQYVTDRLLGRRGNDFMDAMPLYAAAQTSEWVGATMTRGLDFKPDRLSEAEWYEAGKQGFDVMADGEDGLRRFLEDLCSKCTSNQRHSGKAMGRFYGLLRHHKRDPAYAKVRQIVHQAAADRLPLGPGDDVFGAITARRWHTVSTAARLHGQTPRSVATKFRAAGLLPYSANRRGDRSVLVDARKADDLLVAANRAVSSAEAQRMLGMAVYHFSAIVEEGFLTPVMTTKDARKKGAVPYFAVEEIVALKGKLAKLATMSDPAGGLVEIPKATRSAKCGARDFVRLLLKGELKNVARANKKDGYRDMLVDPAEIRQALLTVGPGTVLLPIPQVRKTLTVQASCVRALIDYGQLPVTTSARRMHSSRSRYVCQTDLSAFGSAYVSIGELVASLGRNARWIVRRLTEFGVQPAFDRDLIGTRFFRRPEVALHLEELSKTRPAHAAATEAKERHDEKTVDFPAPA
ncbi:TniQ family protein [Ensifer sp. ENS05]|uniref:TniQ family protein n=1 Tax=Ensifer sp. ENS05 TaxID=2769277 RepID=UPI0017802725|nr:TniQ family protein [Ensifer sp. ENS05]MBD9596960.1 TniQ family protein [Ensifer sp. ENS05]